LELIQKVVAGDWGCTECGANNFARRQDCYKCAAPRFTTPLFSALESPQVCSTQHHCFQPSKALKFAVHNTTVFSPRKPSNSQYTRLSGVPRFPISRSANSYFPLNGTICMGKNSCVADFTLRLQRFSAQRHSAWRRVYRAFIACPMQAPFIRMVDGTCQALKTVQPL